MSNRRRGPIPDELGWLLDALDDYAERLRKLEAPSGEALSNTVATLQALVTDIQAQLDAYMAGKYTNAQIDALIDAKVAAAIAAVLGGTVTIGGSLRVNGNATVDGVVTVPGARATGLASASNRVTAWLAGDGRLGHTAS